MPARSCACASSASDRNTDLRWVNSREQTWVNSRQRCGGLVLRAFMVGGNRPTAVRIELLRGDVLTCWIELSAAELDAATAGVTALIEREVAALVRLRYWRGAAS